MRKLKAPLLIGIVCATPILLFLCFNSPLRSPGESYSFAVNQGESVRSIANKLRAEGLIRSSHFFLLLTRITGKARSIKSGHYDLGGGLRNTQILHVLSKGMVATVKFTIPEGYTMKKIGDYLEETGIITSEKFVEACYNTTILNKYKIPFKSAEGFLFPDTYIVAKDLSALQLAEIMIQRFFVNLDHIPDSQRSIEELKKVVIIASLVEKEAKIDEERELIAAVFYNRLNKGKRLESCASVQYILGETKKRLLYNDLKIDSPYNTYLHSGLPPGPIANMGYKSLFAALHPAQVDYLFFVSKRDGSHYFSSTYEEHLRAIDRYNQTGSIAHQVS
jgi:UPF0755 protein